MNYIEQLNTDEWQNKRQDILERDGNRCTNCGVLRSKYIGISKSFGVKNYDEMVAEGCLFLESALESKHFIFFKDQAFYKVEFIGDESKNIELKKLKFSIKFKEPINEFATSTPYYVSFNEEFNIDELIDLNVHHKYYMTGKMAWEYDNDALVTLCHHCHQEVHKNEEIYVYSDSRNKILLETCWKCDGAGFIPAYHYYKNGVCFACNGHGILE
jgi:hypothetical protein